MTAYLCYLITAFIANVALVVTIPSASSTLGCVTIDTAKLCSTVVPTPIVGPNGCVKIDGVKFCTIPAISSCAGED
ncbi:hypothetical protein CPB84DRAFT_1845318 [Gymnopilus junonius]|uniref:Uncharacterized protein n=1 Tax=Gymnopilus junonius TaxID=109634 RepID=A0A9P5TQ83_GYMJU|nr:hypothetical protein CPB84DRAFT_1845318 [Gymnopilus junonius]